MHRGGRWRASTTTTLRFALGARCSGASGEAGVHRAFGANRLTAASSASRAGVPLLEELLQRVRRSSTCDAGVGRVTVANTISSALTPGAVAEDSVPGRRRAPRRCGRAHSVASRGQQDTVGRNTFVQRAQRCRLVVGGACAVLARPGQPPPGLGQQGLSSAPATGAVACFRASGRCAGDRPHRPLQRPVSVHPGQTRHQAEQSTDGFRRCLAAPRD
jgi:hypothetical protein